MSAVRIAEHESDSKSAASTVENVLHPGRDAAQSEDSSDSQHTRNVSVENESHLQSPHSPALPPDYEDLEDQTTASPPIASLSDKLEQLASAAPAAPSLEQDENTDGLQHQENSGELHDPEFRMEDNEPTEPYDNIIQGTDGLEEQHIGEDTEHGEDYIDETQLSQIHDSLLSTVQEMRLRIQEFSHLRSLAVSKFEVAAEQCTMQLQRISSLMNSNDTLNLQITDIRTQGDGLRHENHILGTENDILRLRHDELETHVRALEAEVQRQSVALTAMTSAVTGLEEWMDLNSSNVMGGSSSGHSQRQTPRQERDRNPTTNGRNTISSPLSNSNAGGDRERSQTPARARMIVRGTGRFRGRYQVDVDDDGNGDDSIHNGSGSSRFTSARHLPSSGGDDFSPQHVGMNASSPSANGNTSDLQDDVRAWIRGCRDVLECAQAGAEALPLSRSARPNGGMNGTVRDEGDEGDGDDWGNFETAQRAA